jgi:SM-20-related protein
MIDVVALRSTAMCTEPFRWAHIPSLFASDSIRNLTMEYPTQGFKTMVGHDAEKTWQYEVCSVVPMGGSGPTPGRYLTSVWADFARALVSDAYRSAISSVTGIDVTEAPVEVNAFHYPAGSWLGPHCDLPTKRITHVFYFNDNWNDADGGALLILRSSDINDVHTTVSPSSGSSALFVRSENSWHAVQPVASRAVRSRRSVVVTFYTPGAPSTMWPEDQTPDLHTIE